MSTANATAKPKPDVSEWYDYRAIRSRNALWNIVAGPRSIGKTYGKKEERVRKAIAEALKRGDGTTTETLWLRRNLTELRPAKHGFFDSIARLFPDYRFRVNGDDGEVQIDGETWVAVIRFAALSTSYQLKGTEYPEVDEIIFDECFAEPRENGEPGTYLPDEVGKLRNLWVTMNRNRTDRQGRAKTKIYLLGNVTALDNPWFLEYDFDASREWQKSGDVVLHLVDASKYTKRVTETMYGTALGTTALDYADGKYIQSDGGMVIPERPADSKPFATLITERGTFGLWEAADYQAMYVTAGPLAAQVAVVTFEPMVVRPGVVLADMTHFIRQTSRRHYRRGSMFLVTGAATPARRALAK